MAVASQSTGKGAAKRKQTSKKERKTYQKATHEDAYMGKCLVIDVQEARDEGTHRLYEEGRLYTDTSVVRSCMHQSRYAIDMRGGVGKKGG